MIGSVASDLQVLRARRVVCPEPTSIAPSSSWVGEASGAACLNDRVHPEAECADLSSPARLAPTAAVHDQWWVTPAVQAPQQQAYGHTRHVQIGPWLYATTVIDDARHPGGLQAAAQQAYTELFEVLRRMRSETGRPLHVLKVWNYLAQINADDPQGALERYRLFNIGRQDAFLEAGHSAFDGAPAACALGTDQGALTVHLLAGPCVPVAVENPRQTSAYRYPAHYGPRAPTFSRAALADLGGGREMLFISGTASIVGHDTLHVGDVQRQTEETLRNLQAVTEAARAHAQGEHAPQDLELTVYVRHLSDVDTVREVIHRTLGPDSTAARSAVYLRADICRADLLVEIEAQHDAPIRAQAPSRPTNA